MLNMTPDDLEAYIDRFEEVLMVNYHRLGDENAKKEARLMADRLGNTNTASLLQRAIDASGSNKIMFAKRHIESARGSLGAMKRENRIW